ncbi:lipopolysaccharide assembly protein LapB [Beggiatoa leptomitoformis]|uniref:Lipopolysaccharide assembly protein B n=1 Tax=Beggiatoa leptomitoformis TaxID=288004 RepID=A0A2N9YEW0_9GAMM|nr:lipopolysaccharide assembly protein LapB [Beggiatoa leptomitoformis]ALG68680.1 lipopolysaccharide assembly protein LapB [Beggiatoa leptomitoformis]AUI68966.1 lipopolysaccharide assembly protein LapB [Beggiatoa leptomitoformis]
MLELLWLLLPVAAASGWLAARKHHRQARSGDSVNLLRFSSDYFRGLNYLLNEQPDKAIDVFIKLIDVDSDTVETHLALGALFRRRGEVNRAIRVHENLIARPSLDAAQRNLAVLELAYDYRRAGLLDRAEALFEKLIESEEHRDYAYHQLLDIYQQEHEWGKAITTAEALASVSDECLNTVIAHYHCEQAEILLQQQLYTQAQETLQLALQCDPLCVRASLLEGELALTQAQWQQAINAFQRVGQQDNDYLSEIIEPLQTCYQHLGRPTAFIAYLQSVLNTDAGMTPILELAKILKAQQGEQEAADFIVKQLHKRPSIRGLDFLLDLALSNSSSITHEHLLLLKDMTTQLLKNRSIYQCSHCGFRGKTLHWQCPSCKQWNTIKPIQGIDGE